MIMNKEDKELLLKDLCVRIPYELKCKICLDEYCGWNPEYDKILADAAKVRPELPSEIREKTYTLYSIEGSRAILLEFEDHGYGVPVEFIKPYLRPISSMTEEEEKEFISFTDTMFRYGKDDDLCCLPLDCIDWLNAHHFDYRGLIDKGLALEAPEGTYKF